MAPARRAGSLWRGAAGRSLPSRRTRRSGASGCPPRKGTPVERGRSCVPTVRPKPVGRGRLRSGALVPSRRSERAGPAEAGPLPAATAARAQHAETCHSDTAGAVSSEARRGGSRVPPGPWCVRDPVHHRAGPQQDGRLRAVVRSPSEEGPVSTVPPKRSCATRDALSRSESALTTQLEAEARSCFPVLVLPPRRIAATALARALHLAAELPSGRPLSGRAEPVARGPAGCGSLDLQG